ncbi:hypothetical protein [Candidatus Aalborgicola defluviihabitans]|uniref:hypothetical protein n=1 Tax=Candidatus Aalborgicola defluviihabitans TaxID=3386187 RepID=UPI001DE83445|nr:hypothetical protein [Burkholderiales bacterium]MBK6567699.1 hypothetical protein [Burkholderiales bacterium]MBK7313089.1 hypothetical protein [Burkholderiales bacterium]MBL0245798.1 hypothetical protein [Rhodoferax sp.]
MTPTDAQTPHEQVGLQFIVNNAFEGFSNTILSTRTKVLLIGGYIDQASAMKAYIARARPTMDRRRKLSAEDTAYVEGVEQYACSAQQYIDWVRVEGGQPIWHEALASYCTAFENCLKAIAVAFLLAQTSSKPNLKVQVKVPSKELTVARRQIAQQWSQTDGDLPRVQQFFQSHILSMKVANQFQFEFEIPELTWDLCSSAFKVRNAIVHNMGYMPYTVSLGNLDLHAAWPIELTQRAIADVATAFSEVLAPFDPKGIFRLI